ncbi:hypothetical protein [Streptomyces sp. NPDC093568]|uniref:hypothetical protein n=1 Tax=Streptomyces sp. NPDC093568 TaxID=3366041 RepID=UPI003808D04A
MFETANLLCPPRLKEPSRIDHIHTKGLKAGIYTDAGKDGCGYYFPTGRPAAPGSGSEGYYEQDMLQFSQY